jgi:hypothetical protein
MTTAGFPWTTKTARDFEAGRRGDLTVEELLALAVIMCVPPMLLLTDPTSATMAVTPLVEVPTIYALLWQSGDQPLHGRTGMWDEDNLPVRLARRLHEQTWHCIIINRGLLAINQLESDGGLDSNRAELRRIALERDIASALQELNRTVVEMQANNMAVPLLVDQELVLAMARARGVTLTLNHTVAGRRQ